MPIVGVVNQKGGVGKTTTSVNVAAELAQRGHSVLLVDADPQGNATTGVGLDKSKLEGTLLEVIEAVASDPENTTAVDSCTHTTQWPNLSIVPSTLDLVAADGVLNGAVGKEMILRDSLDQVKHKYDWIIIDAPPSLGLLTVNILAACDRLVVPVQSEFYALEGLSHLLKTVEMVRKRINPQLEICRVLLTMVDHRNRLSQQVTDDVREYFGDKVAVTSIPRNVRLGEAPGFGEPAVALFPDSKGAEAYKAFVSELEGVLCAAH
ncbi:ParA family protein [Kamptonema cortianum]|nr:ParA family protein [Geitlerinema splendidum]MDK3160388.1 ParA family protein [Kamptonema cortianum]